MLLLALFNDILKRVITLLTRCIRKIAAHSIMSAANEPTFSFTGSEPTFCRVIFTLCAHKPRRSFLSNFALIIFKFWATNGNTFPGIINAGPHLTDTFDSLVCAKGLFDAAFLRGQFTSSNKRRNRNSIATDAKARTVRCLVWGRAIQTRLLVHAQWLFHIRHHGTHFSVANQASTKRIPTTGKRARVHNCTTHRIEV